MIQPLVVGGFQANCYLIPLSDRSCFIVDPGAEPQRILHTLQGAGLTPQWIVCTHGHFDHVGAVTPLIRFFAEHGTPLRLAAPQKESAYFTETAQNRFSADAAALFLPPALQADFTPPPAPDTFLAEGDTLPFAPYRVLETPGHTPGSLCLYNEAAGILFSGDTLFTPGVGRTDMPGGSFSDLMQSLKRLLRLPDATLIYPGHGEPKRLREIRPYFE